MRVYVVEPSAKGGLIHYDFQLCRGLQHVGVDATLVTSQGYELYDLEHNFRVVELLHLWNPRAEKQPNPLWRKVRRGLRGIRYITEWLRLVVYLRREKPDVVLFGEIRFAFEYYFLRMLKSRGLKLADVVHDVRSYDTRRNTDSVVQDSQAHLMRYNRIYNLFDALFVHDASNVKLYLELYDTPPEKVHEITMGASEILLETPSTHTPDELRREFGIPPEQPVILFFGTVTKYKGIEDLIKAFPAVQQVTGAKLVVAGFPAKDVNPDELKELARSLRVYEHVTWYLDYVPNEQVVPLMKMSDVAILPYRAITQSAVLHIAYACGIPVVATRVGGLPDVIEDGKSGLLVPPQDPKALAEAINQLLSLPPEARQAMGNHARMLAETRYQWKAIAERMKSIFEAL